VTQSFQDCRPPPSRILAAETLTRERNVKAQGGRLKAESLLVNEQSLLAESGY
jgi:hypothetical protein